MKAIFSPRCLLLCLALHGFALASDDLQVWTDFIKLVSSGQYTPEMIHPHYETIREQTFSFTVKMKEQINWDEFHMTPEIVRLDNQLCFVLPLTFGSDSRDYSFAFIQEDGQWHLRHIESIMIRLDKVRNLPQSEFPDIAAARKQWMNQEIYWSAQIRIFNHLYEEDPEAAFNWFKDGPGYFLAAQTWVPFVAPHRAFILFLCWDEQVMKGSEITLEKLTDEEAVVTFNPNYFYLYSCTSHFRQQISIENYNRIFETMWHDRASTAGWDLKIEPGEGAGVFRFTRK